MASEDIQEKLKSVSIAALPHVQGDVLCARSSESVQHVVETLLKRNFLSCPVIDEKAPADASWQTRYIGLFDAIQASNLMLTFLTKHPSIPEDVSEDEFVPERSRHSLQFDALQTAYVHAPIGDVASMERGLFPFLPLKNDATLLDAVILLGNYRMRRIPVIDEEKNTIINMITQSSLLHALKGVLGHLGDVVDKTLDELGLAEPQPVHSIRLDQPVKLAFEMIAEHDISAVPVIGSDGSMVGNISARHAYYVVTSKSQMRLLHLSASAFLRSVADIDAPVDIKNTAIYCKGHDTLRGIIEKMDAARIHRIYVCDDSRHPYRVVSLCDILARFSPDPEQTCSLL